MTSTSITKNWEIQSSTGKHFDPLDGLRGIAILMVVAHHAFYTNPASPLVVTHAFHGLTRAGWIGVPLFFVLSGFLISYPFFCRRQTDPGFWNLKGYAARRLGKIVPPFYLSIVIFATYYFLRSHDPAYWGVALKWALGLSNFIQPSLEFNGSYWSLIVEAHFYVLLPLLFWLGRGLSSRHTAMGLFAVLFFVPLAARQLTWPAGTVDWPTNYFLMERFPCQLDYFAWGVLFSGLFVSVSAARDELRGLGLLGYVGAALLALSVGLFALWTNLFDIHIHPTRWSTEVFHVLPGISAFFLLFFVFDPGCLGSRLLAKWPLRFVGIVSYEWFLFHGPVIIIFRKMFGNAHGYLLTYASNSLLPAGLTFLLSALLYHFFSRPILNRIRGKRAAATS